uniref:Phosphatidic acid phosphatase type 2/haloperoxidase domain-containing protein n=1 Tax=Aegilops tauschii subsp. strangulata TaxID=200361 RepID=A0A452ZS51_AEGTS
ALISDGKRRLARGSARRIHRIAPPARAGDQDAATGTGSGGGAHPAGGAAPVPPDPRGQDGAAAHVRLDRAAPPRRHRGRAQPHHALPPLRRRVHDGRPPLPHEAQHHPRLGRPDIRRHPADAHLRRHLCQEEECLRPAPRHTRRLLFSVLITGVLTDAIKDGVGRPRPNFYYRCFPDGVPNYKAVTRQVICHGDAKVIKEGHKSFPSGHTSWSFAGLGFLSWYLAGKIRVFDRGGHIAKLCIVILPLLFAAMVGVSRVADYWHHWQDVFAGGILGLVVASFCYLQFFPHPASKHGLWPHAFRHHNPNPETENQGTTDTHQSVPPHDLSMVQYVASMEMRTNGRALDNMEAGSGRAW